MQVQRAGEIPGHVAVSGPGAAQIDLVERDDVRGGQLGAGPEGVLDLLVPVAVLDVPLNDPHGFGVARVVGLADNPVSPDVVQERVEARTEFAPGMRAVQRFDRGEGCDRANQRAALVEKPEIVGHEGPHYSPSALGRQWDGGSK